LLHSPSGTAFFCCVGLALDLGRQELAEPAHAAHLRVERRAELRHDDARALGRRFGRDGQLLHDAAADHHGIGALPTRLAVAPSRMPKPTPTGMSVCARMRFTIAATSPVSMFVAPVTPFSET
jgi:hypothetical protein